jgi:hypothetical protein
VTAAGRRIAVLTTAAALAAAGCGDDDTAASTDLSAVRDALEEKVRTEIATALYENPGSRADLLADVATDEPELWAEINADGEITLEEFREVRAVANAVLTHGNNVMTDFQERLVAEAEG